MIVPSPISPLPRLHLQIALGLRVPLGEPGCSLWINSSSSPPPRAHYPLSSLPTSSLPTLCVSFFLRFFGCVQTSGSINYWHERKERHRDSLLCIWGLKNVDLFLGVKDTGVSCFAVFGWIRVANERFDTVCHKNICPDFR